MRTTPPVTTGNITVPTERTSVVGKCAHCGTLIRLAYNGDALESSIAHAHPHCADWQRGGMLYLARAGALEPERVTELVEHWRDQRGPT